MSVHDMNLSIGPENDLLFCLSMQVRLYWKAMLSCAVMRNSCLFVLDL